MKPYSEELSFDPLYLALCEVARLAYADVCGESAQIRAACPTYDVQGDSTLEIKNGGREAAVYSLTTLLRGLYAMYDTRIAAALFDFQTPISRRSAILVSPRALYRFCLSVWHFDTLHTLPRQIRVAVDGDALLLSVAFPDTGVETNTLLALCQEEALPVERDAAVLSLRFPLYLTEEDT